MVCFWDSISNNSDPLLTIVGNAKIQGMVGDLRLKGQDYSIALFVFFVPYILYVRQHTVVQANWY